MGRRRRKEARMVVCKAAIIAALVATPLWVVKNSRNPEAVTQVGWHHLATGKRGGLMHPYPKMHKVVVKALDKSTAQVLLGYVGGGTQIEGEYDPNDGTIHIVGDLSRMQASMPPALQPTFRHTLRHEYGHAFLEDWCADHGMDPRSPAFLACAKPGTKVRPDDFPRGVRPVVRAYLSAQMGVYGMPYFTSTFEEFFAESYARYLAGDAIPPAVRKFFDGGCQRVKGAQAP